MVAQVAWDSAGVVEAFTLAISEWWSPYFGQLFGHHLFLRLGKLLRLSSS